MNGPGTPGMGVSVADERRTPAGGTMRQGNYPANYAASCRRGRLSQNDRPTAPPSRPARMENSEWKTRNDQGLINRHRR